MQVNPASWARFCHKARINTRASCRGALFEEDGPHEEACVSTNVSTDVSILLPPLLPAVFCCYALHVAASAWDETRNPSS